MLLTKLAEARLLPGLRGPPWFKVPEGASSHQLNWLLHKKLADARCWAGLRGPPWFKVPHGESARQIMWCLHKKLAEAAYCRASAGLTTRQINWCVLTKLAEARLLPGRREPPWFKAPWGLRTPNQLGVA